MRDQLARARSRAHRKDTVDHVEAALFLAVQRQGGNMAMFPPADSPEVMTVEMLYLALFSFMYFTAPQQSLSWQGYGDGP